MYNEHFGFIESPFNVTPDPRFFYSNRLYQEAFTDLRWGIKLRQGLIVMRGEAGTGKTTLLRMVTEKFESTIRAAFILGPYPDFATLLQLMLVEFGLPKPPGGQFTMMRKLRSYLTEQLQKNQIVSVLFDEAQEMDVRTLKELELLLDLEADDEKLLQVVLAGSLELETKLAHPELRSIKQRVALWCRLAPLQSCEVAPYIDHRVKRVGRERENLFAPHAVEQIALSSRGIPRLINIICDTALFAAFRAGQKSISPEMIQKISHDLRLTEESEPKAAVFLSRGEKGEESVHFSEPNEEDFNARNPVTDDHTAVDEKRQWSFEEFPLGKKNKPNQVRRAKNFGLLKIAGLLAIFVLAGSAAVLFEPSEPLRLENSYIVSAQQTSEHAAEKLAPKVFEKESFGETSPVQVPMPQDPFVGQESEPLSQKTVQAPQIASVTALKTEQVPQKIARRSQNTDLPPLKTDQIGTKVFLHTLDERDRSVLEEVVAALRVRGYTIPETRLSSSRTQGDVRFFFAQDRRDAESVKSIVESEFGRLGYRISLEVLERDGKQFQFAAPGKIEVWIPPLPKS
jgi:general secretion pathway protein A